MTYTVLDDFDESFAHETNMTLADALIEALRGAAHESKECGQAFYVLNDGGHECDVFFLQAVGGPDGHGIHVRNTTIECVAG